MIQGENMEMESERERESDSEMEKKRERETQNCISTHKQKHKLIMKGEMEGMGCDGGWSGV